MKPIFAIKWIGGILLTFLLSFPAFSQVGGSGSLYSNAKVYVSTDKPVNGVADQDNSILINTTKGSYAYIVINISPESFGVSGIKLKTYMKKGGKYEKTDEASYTITSGLSYTYIQYDFDVVGEYAFDVYDKNDVFIGTGYVIAKPDNSSSSSTSTTTTTTSTGKYSKAKVFCSLEVPVYGIASETKSIVISSKGSYAYIVIDNYPTNFGVSGITLKGYRKVDGKYAKETDDEYTISADSYYTYIKYSFYKAGDYAFDVYDANKVFIGTGYVKVAYD
ncbi:MAG: hypothetical protein ABI208_08530 [Ginsengibacter sp.]|jgi:hypothetical protein